MAAPCRIKIMGDFAKLDDVNTEYLKLGNLGYDFAQNAVQVFDICPGIGIKKCDERGFNLCNRLSAAAGIKTAVAHVHNDAHEPPPEAVNILFPRKLVQQRTDIVGGI